MLIGDGQLKSYWAGAERRRACSSLLRTYGPKGNEGCKVNQDAYGFEACLRYVLLSCSGTIKEPCESEVIRRSKPIPVSASCRQADKGPTVQESDKT